MRTKILLILSGVFLLYLALAGAFVHRFLHPALLTVEQEMAAWDVERCLSALQADRTHMALLAADWARWDETCRFLHRPDLDLLQAIFSEEALKNARIDFAFLMNNAGYVLYSLFPGADPARPSELAGFPREPWLLPPSAWSRPSSSGPLQGLFVTARGPASIVASPFVSSGDAPTSSGLLVLGRFLDSGFVRQLAAQTQVDMDIWAVGKKPVPGWEYLQKNYLRNGSGEPRLIIPHARMLERFKNLPLDFFDEGDGFLQVQTTLRDINGNPACILSTRSPRILMVLGMGSAFLLFVSISLIGILFTVVLLFFLHFTVVRPIGRLKFLIRKIREGRDLSARLKTRKKDEIAQLAREFNAMLERLEQDQIRQQELEDDIGHMTRHDLKTPLTSILTMPGLIRGQGGLSASQAELIARIENAGHRMLNMINLSLDLYKMEKKAYPLHPVPVDLLAVARQVVGDLENIAASKRLSVRILHNGSALPESLSFPVAGEELLFYSMLANLVKNALEASPFDASVEIDVRREAGEARVEIRNRGEIPEEIRDVFFEKRVTAGKAGGTGLGTYSARLIAETLGGRIAFTSSAETGTAILLAFPPPA